MCTAQYFLRMKVREVRFIHLIEDKEDRADDGQVEEVKRKPKKQMCFTTGSSEIRVFQIRIFSTGEFCYLFYMMIMKTL